MENDTEVFKNNNNNTMISIGNDIQQNQQSFLQRTYASQVNRPKESYMQFLPFEKLYPRNLRKVGCTPTEKKDTLEIVE
jgi:uncharacterized protein YllA (UPF0747 family)